MKADFSRLTFNARKHYAGVFEQQGRVRLEADGNEEVFIRLHREQQEAIDVIGHCGVPEPGNAFRITPIDGRADNFAIAGGPGALGRCYVEGLMCELEQSTTYLEQPDLPNPDPLPLPIACDEAAALVYLEVWQRLVTYLEDEAIREVGLGDRTQPPGCVPSPRSKLSQCGLALHAQVRRSCCRQPAVEP